MARPMLPRSTAAALAACLAIAAPAAAQIPMAERQQAAQQHGQILEQFGGAYGGRQGAYVAEIGERIADAAGLRGQCTVTLVNTDAVNAFAVPGCYVYVTRGLFSIVNSEDELAFVIGHEIGHAAGRHSQSRQNRSTLSGLGALIVGILTKREDVAQIAAQGAQLYTLSFSRNQEYEADTLGLRYMTQAGYDARAAADMLDALERHDRILAQSRGRIDAQSTPQWASTHPVTADRIQRVSSQGAVSAPGYGLPQRRGDRYYEVVQGMLFGDDPEQGFVMGRAFAHPTLRIAFEAPQGFTLTNGSQAVLLEGPNGAKAQFSGGRTQGRTLEDHATAVLRAFVGQSAAQAGQGQRTTINGLEAVLLPARVQTQSGVADVTVAAYRLDGSTTYHFLAVAPQGRGASFNPLFRSFRVLSANEAAGLRPRRINVVTARPGESVGSLASRMAMDDLRAEWFAMLNDLEPNAPLRPGQRVKLVEYAR